MPGFDPTPNLDVYQMQAGFAAQQQQTYPQAGYYNDQQAMMTGYRASYGDVPAMLMSGAQSAGSAFMGAAEGVGSMFSAIGSMLRPIGYAPPATVFTGYYGQYEQQTGPMRELAIMAGAARPPRGINAYQYGYNAASNFGERAASLGFAGASVGAGLAAGWAGGKAGTALGAAVGSVFGPVGTMVGGTVGGIAGSIGGYMGIDAPLEAVSQRREISSFLERSSFRYVGAGNEMADPRLGGGMSFGARRETIDYMKRLDIRDPSMGMDDLYNVLQGSTNLGLFGGAGDMDSFKKKFKDIVDGVKAVTKTLNTTLEEGLQVIKDFKAINIDASQMSAVSLQASAIGKVTGRTGQEIVGLGMQGAEMYRGTGIEMKVGYQAQVMNMAAIRSARDSGLISQEAIVQAGGEEAMAQRMTAGGLQFMQSALGRGFGAAFYNPAAGPAGFDMGAFQRNAMGGGGNMVDLAYRTAQNLSNPQAIIDFTVNQEKFMSEMGKSFGGRGTQIGELSAASAAAKFYQEMGVAKDYQSGLKYSLMVDQGKTAQQADDLIRIAQNAPKEFADKMRAFQATQVQLSVDEAYRTSGLHYRWDVFADRVSEALEPTARTITNNMDKLKERIVGWWDQDVKGVTRYDYEGIGYRSRVGQSLPKVYAPGPSRLGDISGMSSEQVSRRMDEVGVMDLSRGGGFFNPTKGEQMLDALQILGLGGATSDKVYSQLSSDDVVLGFGDIARVGSGYDARSVSTRRTISRSALRKELEGRTNLLEITKDRALAMAAEDRSIAAPGMNIGAAVAGVYEKLGDKATLQDVVGAVFGGDRTLESLSKSEYATLLLASDRIDPLGKIMDREVRATRALQVQYEGLSVESKAVKEKQYKAIGTDLAKEMGLTGFLGFGVKEIPKAALESLSEARTARAAGDAGAAELALERAVKQYKAVHPGASDAEITAKFGDFAAGDRKYSSIQSRLERTEIGLLEEQVAEGGKTLLKAQTTALGTLKLEDPVKAQATAYLKSVYTGSDASRVQALGALSAESEVGKVVEKLPMGAQLFDAKKSIDLVSEATKKLKEIDTLKEQGRMDPKEAATQKEAVKKGLDDNLAKHMTLASESDRKLVVSKTMEGRGAEAQGAIAGLLNLQGEQTVGANAPGARPGAVEGSGTAQGSAAEITAQQININYEILEALRALNVGRR